MKGPVGSGPPTLPETDAVIALRCSDTRGSLFDSDPINPDHIAILAHSSGNNA
jgi:hypothetical protein